MVAATLSHHTQGEGRRRDERGARGNKEWTVVLLESKKRTYIYNMTYNFRMLTMITQKNLNFLDILHGHEMPISPLMETLGTENEGGSGRKKSRVEWRNGRRKAGECRKGEGREQGIRASIINLV